MRYTSLASVQLCTRSADLATDVGLAWATKLFGEEAIASLPIRATGKNKGKPKGFVIWRKALNPGYCREVCGPLAVGQIADAWIGAGSLTLRSAAVYGQWLGRSQPLAASASAGAFFADGRDKHAQEQARLDAERDEMAAERMTCHPGSAA